MIEHEQELRDILANRKTPSQLWDAQLQGSFELSPTDIRDMIEKGIKDGEFNLESSHGLARLMSGIDTIIKAAEAKGREWKPIETAPKDGTYVILVDCDLVTIGKWMNSDALRDEAWVGFDSIQSLHKTCVMEPTHWMPLPSPPGTVEEGGVE